MLFVWFVVEYYFFMTQPLLAFLNAHYADAPFRAGTAFETQGQRQASLVHGASGRYVVKITDPGRREATVETDTRTMAYLSQMGFPAPCPLPSQDGRLYLDTGEKPQRFLYLYPYIPGTAPRPGDSFFRRLGETLASLHALPWEGQVPLSAYRPADELALIRPRVEAVSDPAQRPIVEDLLGMIDRFPTFDDLPTGIIHTDPYFVNLLETPGGAIYLIDWDDAGVSYPLLDVGYVVAHLCSFTPRDRALWGVPGAPEGLSFRPDWARLFLDAYQSVRPLSALEQQYLADAVRLSFLVYIIDWSTGALIEPNYQRMKMVEQAMGFKGG